MAQRAASTKVFWSILLGDDAEASAPANNPCAKTDGIMGQVLYVACPTKMKNERIKKQAYCCVLIISKIS
jgi:hypothetical protein